jgi:hypothetical protein
MPPSWGSLWPPAYIPNSSPSRERFKPDEPVLRLLRRDSMKKHHPRSLGLNLRFCLWRTGFDNRTFPVSLLKSITLAFERLFVEIRYSIGPLLLLDAKWFRRSDVPCITVEKRHPRLRAPVHQNPVQYWTFAFVGCEMVSAIGRSLYHC